MWKDLGVFIQTLFTLARDQQRAQEEIKEIRQDLTNLTLAVSQIANKIALVQQENNRECEKLAMQMQIDMLKFEKQLPKTNTSRRSKEGSNNRTEKSGG
jgi:hypothetical protein